MKSKILSILFFSILVFGFAFNACQSNDPVNATTTTTTTGVTYSINQSKCVRCGNCLSACKYGALTSSSSGVTINTSKCTGCGSCVGRCSHGAITKN